MSTNLQTGFFLFVSLWLFVSLVAVTVVVMLVVSATLRPGRWFERFGATEPIQCMAYNGMPAST